MFSNLLISLLPAEQNNLDGNSPDSVSKLPLSPSPLPSFFFFFSEINLSLRILLENVVQLWLQTSFLSLSFGHLDTKAKIQSLASILASWSAPGFFVVVFFVCWPRFFFLKKILCSKHFFVGICSGVFEMCICLCHHCTWRFQPIALMEGELQIKWCVMVVITVIVDLSITWCWKSNNLMILCMKLTFQNFLLLMAEILHHLGRIKPCK